MEVHHLGVSQSERIVWLCEELGLDYDLVKYDRDPETRLAPDSYRALHPMGIAPVIRDGDVCLGESGAIVAYILAKYGDGQLSVDKDAPNFPDYLFWYEFANATLLPANMTEMIATFLGASGHPAMETLSARSKRAYPMVDQRLGEAQYFAGDEFSAADIMMVFPLTTMRAFVPRDLSAYPNILAYLKRIGARPAYQRAMAKGDPEMTPMLD